MNKKSMIFVTILIILGVMITAINISVKSNDFEDILFSENEEKSGQGIQKLSRMELLLQDLLGEKYDEFYGGSWLDDNFMPFYAMTYIDEDIKRIAGESDVTLINVKYSFSQLEEIMNHIPVSQENGIFQASIIESLNAVEIGIEKKQYDTAIKLIESNGYLSEYYDAYYIISAY